MGTYSIIKCIGSLSAVPGTRAPKTLDFPGDSSVFVIPNEPLRPCLFVLFCFYLLIFYFGCAGSSRCSGFSVVARAKGYALVSVLGPLIAVPSPLQEQAGCIAAGTQN